MGGGGGGEAAAAGGRDSIVLGMCAAALSAKQRALDAYERALARAEQAGEQAADALAESHRDRQELRQRLERAEQRLEEERGARRRAERELRATGARQARASAVVAVAQATHATPGGGLAPLGDTDATPRAMDSFGAQTPAAVGETPLTAASGALRAERRGRWEAEARVLELEEQLLRITSLIGSAEVDLAAMTTPRGLPSPPQLAALQPQASAGRQRAQQDTDVVPSSDEKPATGTETDSGSSSGGGGRTAIGALVERSLNFVSARKPAAASKRGSTAMPARAAAALSAVTAGEE